MDVVWKSRLQRGRMTTTIKAPPEGRQRIKPQRAKQKALTESALSVFLSEGFAGASLDKVAEAAGVSKRTIYNHFASKEDLFLEIVGTMVEDILEPVDRSLTGVLPVDELLCDFARRYADVMLSESRIALHRLVLGEMGRFPSLGQIYFVNGYERARRGVAHLLERLVLRGQVAIDDCDAAANFFWQMTISPLQRDLLFRPDTRKEDIDVDGHLRLSVTLFLRMYAPEAAPEKPLRQLAEIGVDNV